MSTRTANPGPTQTTPEKRRAANAGRLLIVSFGSRHEAPDALESTAAAVGPAVESGLHVEWIHAEAHPTSLGSRAATWRADAASLVAAARERAVVKEAQERAASAPPTFFRRVEDRAIAVKHDESASVSARLLARLRLRLARPLRKLQERGRPDGSSVAAALPAEPADAGEADITELLRGCGEHDVVLLTAAKLADLEWLLFLVPALGVDRPLAATLHVAFGADATAPADKGAVDLETLGRRWLTGAPFRHTYFQADASATAAALAEALALPVHTAAPRWPEITAAAIGHSAEPDSNLVTVEKFGPVALQVTAMWGRTGSTSIFDSQARYLVQRGFLVIRVLIDHWPHHGDGREERINQFLAENFEGVRPHSWAVVERDISEEHLARWQQDPSFTQASTLGRMLMQLSEPTLIDPQTTSWAGRNAALALVNHIPHVPFAERLTSAPVVFETHDIYSNLLTSHGVPEFVPENPKTPAAQLAEETAVFARVAACVNLSEDDDAIISRHAKISHVISPYARSRTLARRSWPDVVHANELDEEFRVGNFDLMLWGDWHGGNIAGICWFVEEVMPRFERLQNARVVIAGRVAKGLPEGLAEKAGLLVAGFVDHLDDFILRTKVLLVPDQGGTGISIKAMDIFAFGRAFVSTSPGMRCVDCGDTGYAPVDDPDAFGQEVVDLLESRSAREERAETARRLYELNFSRAAYADNWDAALAAATPEALTAAGPAPAAAAEEAPSEHTETATMTDPNGDAPRISIIICTYDRYDVLPDAIASAKAQDLPAGQFEILVIDNSPDQEAAARWAAEYEGDPAVRYHLEPTPGLSNARNVGTEMARAPVVSFIDDDAIAPPHWAAEVLDAFDAFPDAGIVGGKVHPKWIGDESAPWLHEDNIGYLSVINWGDERRKAAPNEWLAGCNISFRRDVLLESGGFSRSLGRIGSGASLLSNEETAVAEKIHAMGKISVYAPAADLQHVIDPQRLSREWFRKRAAWQAVSDFIKDPQKAVEYAPRAKQHLQDAIEKGWRKVPMGSFHDTQDKETFKGDMGVMYDIIMSCLTGGFELPSPPDADEA